MTRNPPRRWLFGNSLLPGYVSMLGGVGGSNKSTLANAVALSLATGRSLLGAAPQVTVHERANAWIYNLEDDLPELERRLAGMALHYGLDFSHLENRVCLDSGRDCPMVIAGKDEYGRVEIREPIVDAIIDGLCDRNIKLLVVDPFSASHAVGESLNDEIKEVMNKWSAVADQAKTAILLVHHFRKGGAGGDADAFRGGSAQQGAARSMQSMAVMTAAEADEYDLPPFERHEYVRLDSVKNNMAPAADTLWF